MNDTDANIWAFFVGILVATIIILTMQATMRPTLEEHELYRFCLIKNIPLEECLIPNKPYKGIND